MSHLSPKYDISSNFRIRKVEYEDLDRILSIEKSSFPTPWPRHMFKVMYSRNQAGFRVAVAESEVIGYGIIGIEKTLRRDGESLERVGHLLNLAVQEGYRGDNIGSALLEELEAHVKDRDVKEIWLEVREGNQDARQFYLNKGFEDVGIRNSYYPDGVNAVIMRKKF